MINKRDIGKSVKYSHLSLSKTAMSSRWGIHSVFIKDEDVIK